MQKKKAPALPQVAPTPVPPLCDVKVMRLPPPWEVKEKTGALGLRR